MTPASRHNGSKPKQKSDQKLEQGAATTRSGSRKQAQEPKFRQEQEPKFSSRHPYVLMNEISEDRFRNNLASIMRL